MAQLLPLPVPRPLAGIALAWAVLFGAGACKSPEEQAVWDELEAAAKVYRAEADEFWEWREKVQPGSAQTRPIGLDRRLLREPLDSDLDADERLSVLRQRLATLRTQTELNRKGHIAFKEIHERHYGSDTPEPSEE